MIRTTQAMLLASTVLVAPNLARADHNTAIDGNNGTLPTPTGQYVTPQAVTGFLQQPLNPGLSAYPNFVAGEAVKSALSPDGSTLAVLTAGFNSHDTATGATDTANSTQYVFLYNIAGANKSAPVLTQVLRPFNTFVGLAWSTDGNTLYVGGGADDCVYYFTKSGSTFGPTGGTKIALGHGGIGFGNNFGSQVPPNAGGLGLSPDGSILVVANNYNDSISVISTASKSVLYESDLRPYATYNEGVNGAPGGTYPYAVTVLGSAQTNDLRAYVTSDRDREVVVMRLGTQSSALVTRIPLDGNGQGMTLGANGTLYVAEENADEVAVINTATNTVTGKIDTRAPAGVLPPNTTFTPGTGQTTGVSTTAVTLNPTNNTLYAVNSGANTIAVIPLGGAAPVVTGLIPTAYEPHDITFSPDGTTMYIVNGKSDTGPNNLPYPGHLSSSTGSLSSIALPFPGSTQQQKNQAAVTAARASNTYQFQLEKATLVSALTPTASDLPAMTAQAELNNGYNAAANPFAASDAAVMAFVRAHIQHVIYIVKENRTFDQILGDLANGSNGDPSLTMFGKRATPNFHMMASQFVTLDNFQDPGDGSMDGWSWSMAGRVTNTETLSQQINYAFVNRGLSYEGEGYNRGVPVGLSGVANRDAATSPPGRVTSQGNAFPGGPANFLAGQGNHAATDAPYGYQKGYIFDAVLAAGGTIRNYGFLANSGGIGSIGTNQNPVTNPFAAGIIQELPLNPSLINTTDLYFRAYDQNYPDVWRFNEWNREFQQFDASNTLPSLSMIRFSHDHMGSFGTALAGVNTPETQQADNDLAVGKLVQAVANSVNYSRNTLIMVIEDDCQDGPDHYDSHRTTAYVVGPYVKQGAVVSTRYNQVSLLRTIEDIFATQHINLNTAYQRPMADVFDTGSNGSWSFTPIASRYLSTTSVLSAIDDKTTQFAEGPDLKPTHDAAYWARVTRGFDFSAEDRVPPDLFNEVLWKGMMGDQPFPAHPTGEVLGRPSGY